MGESSKIEWTDHTFNPWVGCEKVSPGCDHCYAESWAKRIGSAGLWQGQRRRTSVSNWKQPLKWNSACAAAGTRARVFCASLADVFDNTVDREWRADLFALIKATPHLDWLLLTKRIGNAKAMLPTDWGAGYPNVWIGATMVNQPEIDRDLEKLLDIPARIRFLSIEPMLSEIYFSENMFERIDWVICGGESGGKARRMDVTWATLLRAQCKALGIAFFMKQGSAANWPDFKNFASFLPVLQVREFPA
jgi:protein gp37